MVQLKVMPEGVDTDLKQLQTAIKTAIPEDIQLVSIVEKPIAFGLVALELTVKMPDVAGGADKLVDSISKLAEVESVEVISVSLI